MANYVYYKIKISSNDKIDKSKILTTIGVERNSYSRYSYYIDLNKYVKLPEDLIMNSNPLVVMAISKYVHENDITDEAELVRLKSKEDYIYTAVANLHKSKSNINGILIDTGMTLQEYIKDMPKDIPILDSDITAIMRMWGSTSNILCVAVDSKDDYTMDIYFRVNNHPLTDYIHTLIIKRIKDVCNCDITMTYMEEFMRYIGKVYYHGCTNSISLKFINSIYDIFEIIKDFQNDEISVGFNGTNEYIINDDLISFIKYRHVRTIDELCSAIKESKLRLFNTEINCDMIEEDREMHISENDCQWILDSVYDNLCEYVSSSFDNAVISKELVENMFGDLFKFISNDTNIVSVGGK